MGYEGELKKKLTEKKRENLDKLPATTRPLGVSLNVWVKRNEDGKGSGQYDFTSLLVSDKKKLLKNQPGKVYSPRNVSGNK